MKIFHLYIATKSKLDLLYQAGVEDGKLQLYPKIALAHTAGYNEGKAAGIKQAKRAFALALKQKGESNNDVLR